MSHDALLTREISDFYNVPIDSDIYALPVDMIKSEKERSQHIHRHSAHSEMTTFETKETTASSSCSKHTVVKCHHQTKANRKNKNKRKKRSSANGPENGDSNDRPPSHISTSTTSRYTSTFFSTSNIQEDNNVNTAEPLHMSLDEVKQFYHTLYSETKTNSFDGGGSSQPHSKTPNINLSSKGANDSLWNGSTVRSRSSNSSLVQGRPEKSVSSHTQSNNVSQKNFASDSETQTNNNNNNNMIAVNNHNNQNQSASQPPIVQHLHDKESATQTTQSILKANIIPPNEKKSQFTLNLKQRFCSIFRFRRSHNRCSSRSDSNDNDENVSSNEKVTNISKSNEDKRKKFQSRALPPLPKKGKFLIKLSLIMKSLICDNLFRIMY